MQFIRQLLLPFSWIYALVVWVRNGLYNKGVLQGEKGALPTVVIGNIHAGGTGKSPHTLKLASLLEKEVRLAILSRGYGRKTSGFLLWKKGLTAADFGDEPLQYVNRLSETTVAVCEDRLAGIRQLKTQDAFQLVMLDDAFQHRKLIGDLNIVLMREAELPQDSRYLPTGNLRDHLSRLKDADIVIITGVTSFWDEGQKENFRKELPLSSDCLITSSTIRYGTPLNGQNNEIALPSKSILVTGIAHPQAFSDHVSSTTSVTHHFNYSDHYAFSPKDYSNWKNMLNKENGSALITTEKDFMRINSSEFDADRLIYIPISIEIDDESAILERMKAVYSPKK